mmetsp:Transcript_22524/g.32252  ORF Transcript_22524/g.32252 Transcript_22524/m.32252 type:complete len:217 (+) Transcript_22524:2-652(+)
MNSREWHNNRNASRGGNNNYFRGREWQQNNALNAAARWTYQGDPQQAEHPASSARSDGDASPIVNTSTSSSAQANHLLLHQSITNQSIKEVTSNKDFDDMTFEEKLREQLSKVSDSEYFRLESSPVEFTVLLPQDIDCKEARDAANKAVNEVMERQEKKREEVMKETSNEHEDEDESINNSDDSDDYDEYERRAFKKMKTNDPGYDFTREEIESFC